MPFSMPELSMPVSLNEVLRGDKSKHNTSGESAKDSPLKRAVKENEQSVIQSIVALEQLPSSHATNNINKNSSGDGVKTTETGDQGLSLSSLLDYLFEDGQLTRIEYDKVDKCDGINSATEQAQVLLRLLLNSKDDEALEILLKWLRKVDPKSETLRKLPSNIVPENPANETKAVFDNENEAEFIILEEYFPTKHDFYYGKRQHDAITGERLYDLQDYKSESNNTLSFIEKKRRARQQKRTATDNKTKSSSAEPIDSRDFYLTNGCLETLRNLILFNCDEALSVLGWGKVLRNMNGLLSLDVLSIKDLLCQIKTMDHQRATEEETRMAKMVRKIYRERRELQHQPNNLLDIQKPTGNTLKTAGGKGEYNENENVFKQSSNQERTNGLDQSTIKYSKYGSVAKWKQIIYRTLQLWKLRNGSYSTFYSLVGVFQHSNLYQTADFLLERKKEIQSRENENDVDEGNINDVNTGTKPTFSTYQ